jgi:aldose 1-epimerase
MKPAMSLSTQPASRRTVTPGAWGHAPRAQAVTLCSELLAVEILPGLAGGISSLSWRGDGVPIPLLQAGALPQAAGGPGVALACRPLVNLGVCLEPQAASACGLFAAPQATGSAPWRIESAGRAAVTLVLDHPGRHPYRLTQTFVLDQASLSVRLELLNTGRRIQALGLGLSCSFARDGATWLAAAAAGLWCGNTESNTLRHTQAPPAWRFGLAYPLPASGVFHAFSDWAGVARVRWPQRGLALALSGDTNGYVLSTPRGADCFGFHLLDCAPDVAQRGLRPESGTLRLAPGAGWVREFVLRVEVEAQGAVPAHAESN